MLLSLILIAYRIEGQNKTAATEPERATNPSLCTAPRIRTANPTPANAIERPKHNHSHERFY